ncbi:hypothetical protein K3G63_19675 [Hymenobacter sp. HSC-4F20]|uniref:hypothetical protein n=1 Tax=Hymenobacter sp. HSC-4F20 TaxID=2864135 RepID=UPI001C72D558|nr:hypothetical protein [Hymenobacter sp. HSC-4F20]MBX0292674.1 hypothetical protein [Hymenobacter sp. HSC-4F20]
MLLSPIVRFAFAFLRATGWLWLGLASSGVARAQTDSLTSVPQQFTRYQQQTLQEKLFLHLDRPVYLSGEVMWFKVYATDGTYSKPLSLSTVAYVEVLDKNRRAVLQGKIPLKNATGRGSFQLASSLPSGSYTVRAYTNWMKNFSPDFYFHSSVTIVNTARASGVVSTLDTASYDVQFFPEGGNLVQGISSKVAFKVTDRAGRSVPVEGTVLNAQGQPLTTFKTLRFGLGSFWFTPSTAAAYTARLKLPTGRVVSHLLPAAHPAGYVMRLEAPRPAQLNVVVQAPGHGTEPVLLLVHARQRLLVATSRTLVNGRAEFALDPQTLAEGISHFTVFNSRRQPVCERLYFRRPAQPLRLSAQTDRPTYPTRTKVSVRIATGATEQPSPASLSVAVYRLDSLSATPSPSISSYLWLTSDLRGTVENPDYYLTSTEAEVAAATDNLMLTHGWRRFRWEDVLRPQLPAFAYLPELNGHLIQGQITHRTTNQPAADVTAYLTCPGRLARLSNSISGPTGNIQFETTDFYGPREIIVQTNPRQDSTYRVDIFSPYSAVFATGLAAPVFAPYARFRDDFTQRHVQTQVHNTYFRNYNNVFAPPPVDSLAFYGQPDERYRLDDYTRFKTVEEVLREYVPGVKVRLKKDGFHFTVLDNPNRSIFTDPPLVLVDGVPVFNTNHAMALDPLTIQKLEVLDRRYFQGRTMYSGIVSFTTYKGNLGGLPLDARALVQEYEGLQVPREFYAPRYDTPQAQQSRLPDLRNLLYWNPSVTTTGSAPQQLEFYTGDQAGRYVVVVQGLSNTGLAGSTSCTFEVKQPL